MPHFPCQRLLLAAVAVFHAVALVAAQSGAALPAVPIGLGGKEPAISREFIRLMLPEYDVVHVIHSAPNGKSEFLPLLMGEETIPASGLGSNIANPLPQIPRAIFIGGGFSPSEINEMYGSSLAMQGVPWVYPTARKRANGTVVPPTDAIVARVKQVFAANGLVPGNNTKPAPGVWSF